MELGTEPITRRAPRIPLPPHHDEIGANLLGHADYDVSGAPDTAWFWILTPSMASPTFGQKVSSAAPCSSAPLTPRGLATATPVPETMPTAPVGAVRDF